MKIKLFLIELLTISALFCGCNSEPKKTKISFGTFNDSHLVEMTYEEIVEKMENKESMIVSSYYDYVASCQCQSIFNELLEEYANEHNLLIYSFNNKDLPNKDEFGFRNFKYSNPSIYIINKGNITQQFFYSQKAYEDIFVDKSKLAKCIEKYCLMPQMYYVNDNFLDDALPKTDKACVCYIRNSCSDCKYLIPNYILPKVNDNNISCDIWLIDLDPYRDTPQYQEIKDKYQLSEKSNPTFGYGEGFVPTIQYYEKGKIVSATVYFNDEIVAHEDGFIIASSYYSEERVPSLQYLDSSDVLVGKIIKKEEVVSSYWLPKFASVYHNQILDKFFNYYLY